jgi:hypothetical protein
MNFSSQTENDLILRNHFSGMLCEVDQHGHHFRLDANGLLTACESVRIDIDRPFENSKALAQDFFSSIIAPKLYLTPRAIASLD